MNTSTDALVGWTPASNTRGTYTLIWSCLATIFACTWTILHLNVPGLHDSTFQRFLRKVKWMAISILFPEFILSKAICDLRLALDQLRQFDDYLRDNGREPGIAWTTTTTSPPGRRTVIQDWEWKIKYPKCTRLIYGLLALPSPLEASKWYSDLVHWCSSLFKWCPALLHRLGRRERKPNSNDHRAHNDDLSLCEDQRLQPVIPDLPGPSATPGSPVAPGLFVTSGQSDLPVTPGPGLNKHAGPFRQLRIDPDAIRQQKLDEAMNPAPRREQKPQEWTVVHSYYAQMGGLVYQIWDSQQQYCALTAWKLTSRYCWEAHNPDFDHPLMHLVLNEEDIQDKSKADVLAKIIATLQIAWLIVNLVARGVTGLPITQLEIATMAFAVLAILTYMANFWKPKDVLEPTILHIQMYGKPGPGEIDPSQSLIDRLWSTTDGSKKVQDGKLGHKKSGDSKSDRVHNDSVWLEGDTPLIIGLMAVSSFLFGGLHCIAWNYEFPSVIELTVWRVASLVSTFLPVVLLILSLGLGKISNSFLESQVLRAFSSNINHWDQLPDDWWNRLTKPHYLDWNDDELSAMLSMPPPRNWDQKPSAETIEAMQANETQPNQFDIHFMRDFPVGLGSIRETWKAVLGPKSVGPPAMRRMELLEGPARSGFERRLLAPNWGEPNAPNPWDDYETFVRPDARSVKHIWKEAYIEADKQTIAMKKRQGNIQDASKILNAFGGIVYALSRLLLMVVIFSCLRATPERVYETPSWIQFIPNIS